MYKSSTELIGTELRKETMTPIFKVLENANIIYKDIMKNEFFKSEYVEEIRTRVASFAIKRQFDSKYLMKNFPFSVNSVTMPFKQKRVELTKGNILLTIAKANRKNQLPCPSKYKRNYASNNWGLENQIMIDIFSNDIRFKQEPYYGIIVFGLNEHSLDFVDLVIPDYKYQTILEKVELKPKFTVHKIEDIKKDKERILFTENIKKEVLAKKLTLSEGD